MILNNLKKEIKKVYRRQKAKRTSFFVIKYYKTNFKKGQRFVHNIWNNNKYWDYFFQNLPNGKNSKFYVPFDFYSGVIEPNFNSWYGMTNIRDKNYYDLIFAHPEIISPRTIFRRINGVILDGNYKPIILTNSFLNSLKEELIVKQSNNSHGGQNVEKFIFKDRRLVNIKGEEEFTVENINEKFGQDFIVQEIVQQHKFLAELHPESLNTIKMLTLVSPVDNKFYMLGALVRMGVGNEFKDNSSAGGIMVGIKINEDGDGFLRDIAFDQWGKTFFKHPTNGVEFKGREVPSFKKMVQISEELAYRVPYQRIIGWDFSVNQNGSLVLIEANTGSGIWASQMANGEPLFGDLSEEIFKYINRQVRR